MPDDRTYADVDRRCLRVLLLVLAFVLPGLAARGLDAHGAAGVLIALALLAGLWLLARLVETAAAHRDARAGEVRRRDGRASVRPAR